MAPPRKALVNVVPTPRTRTVARRMIETATELSGPDAVVRHLNTLEEGQVHALLGILLNQVKVTRKPGRPRMANQLSEEERRRGYSQYRQGVRTEFAVQAYREYQRTAQQRRRDSGGDPARARRQTV